MDLLMIEKSLNIIESLAARLVETLESLANDTVHCNVTKVRTENLSKCSGLVLTLVS